MRYRPDSEKTYCPYCKCMTFDNVIANCVDCANDILNNPRKWADKLKSKERIQQVKDIENR